MKRLISIAAASVLLAAGCGGDNGSREAEGEANLAEPQLATTDPPRGDGVDLDNATSDDGVVTGVPSLEDVEDAPPAALGSAQANCSGTRVTPSVTNVPYIQNATLCLLNAERSARGMAPLRLNRALSRAARRHAADMVRRKYFSHVSRSGETFVDRIRATGYLRNAPRWTVGENLAWGSAKRATPAEIVRAWMKSPGHRANILNPRYREVGLGVVVGAPVPITGAVTMTYSNDFGSRS